MILKDYIWKKKIKLDFKKATFIILFGNLNPKFYFFSPKNQFTQFSKKVIFLLPKFWVKGIDYQKRKSFFQEIYTPGVVLSKGW